MVDSPINSKTNSEEIVNENGTILRRSIAHLPSFYRTDTNHRFLTSTLDQLIQPGSLTRLDGYIGRTYAYTRKPTDKYITSASKDRDDYQLEPAVTYTDKDTSSINPEDQVKFTATYDDYINQIKFFGGNVDNHDRLNKEEVYNWNPAVDFDKLINYREYYWLPEGPNPILISNNGPNSSQEIKVLAQGQAAYQFSTHAANNPSITLYRGNTYKFIIDAAGHPFYIMTEPFKTGFAEDGSTSVIYSSGVTNNGASLGTLTFTVPSAAPDVLYYQCGNHQAMQGIFIVKTISSTTKINPAHEIVGSKNYVTGSGVHLSNGMKLRFGDNVISDTYRNKEFYVEGVGQSITLTDSSTLITPESYATESTELYDTVQYDTRPYAISFYRPETPDYITIKRDSIDGNAWSRYNRWVHRAVIDATAAANGYTPNLLESDRAKRPIIEFDSGLRLYDHGITVKRSITLIDASTTDAFSSMVRQTGYIVDGVALANGMRILLTNDRDPRANNKIYTVNFVSIGNESVISLTLASDNLAGPQDGESVFVELGTINQGKTFFYDSAQSSWMTGQQKTKLNQQPLFNLYDDNSIPLNDSIVYPNSTFNGAKVFAYQVSDAATTDTVLGLKVKYSSINNVGNMVFTTDISSGSFNYKSGEQFVKKNLSTAQVAYSNKNNGAVQFKTSWVKRNELSKQRVIRTFIVDSSELKRFPIDVYNNSSSIQDLQIHVDVNDQAQSLGTDYTLANGTTNKFVIFSKNLSINDLVKIQCFASEKKLENKGVYEIPENLSTNPLNEQISEFTFGQVLNHVHDINEKNETLVGSTPGNSNLRDIPDVRLQGGTILQHSAALPPAMFLLIDQNANAISAIDYCSLEYQKFKENFLSQASDLAREGTVASKVDTIIKNMTGERTSSFPFFYEDMIGYGERATTRNYTVQDATQTQFAIDSQFDTTAVSNRAVYVYLNDVILISGLDYTFSTVDDSVEIICVLAEGDIITIKEYDNTTGSFVPPTPTKLGLYPKYKPEIVTDTTYVTPTQLIIGHDGSRTVAYGDYRDDLLMELEKRIYNNCKTQYNPDLLTLNEVKPSVFVQGEYKLSEIDNILSYDFYTWTGRNSLDYQYNDIYAAGNEFTYNYARNKDAVKQEYLPGHWRGIYNYFYDTDRPHTHPWEMLGYSQQPTWWAEHYGPAPYSSGNELLWNDLAAGFDHGLHKSIKRYIRPNLLNYLPVDVNGNLKSPLAIGLVAQYEQRGVDAPWKFGDQSPVETAWRKSSQYPYTIMKLLALTRPAKFFGTFFDNSRLSTNPAGNVIDSVTRVAQTLRNAKYHLETATDSTTGVITRYMTAGYQPFVVNYIIKNNLDPAPNFYDKMKNLNVQLAYKLGGFTDKQNLKILTDSVSPGSTAGSQFIPDENYKILFRSSNPVDTFDYSGVLVELNSAVANDGSTLEGGYKIIGYNTIKPYFKIFEPLQNNNSYTLEVGSGTAVAYKDWSTSVKIVPYGTVFRDPQSLVNFLIGYGKYLESRGFVFERFSNELGETMDWVMSAKEFLYWTRQGWAPGSAITLSPGAEGFSLNTVDSVIGKLQNLQGEYTVLDSAGKTINTQSISTKRIGSTFEIVSKNTEIGIYHVTMNAVQKEHVLLFDNVTVFSDIILQLATGFRQERLKLIGWKTGDWNGDYYSPGFIFDEAKINAWTANTDYQIGSTVEYNAKFYVAKTNHNSGNVFNGEYWQSKNEKPISQLIPNFDYKISQFNDFYDLESDNFDEGQQKLAQHLTGYQSRDYLENLFLNDVSQYKFYQGFIREKGTQNAIDKLLKAKFLDENISLSIYPEWMIKVGEFGNTQGKNAIQIRMPDDVFVNNIQSIELLDSDVDDVNWVKSVAVRKNEMYQTPLEYTAAQTFNKYDYSLEGVDRDVIQKFRTAGYPRLLDVQHTVFNEQDLLNLDMNQIQKDDLVWIAKKSNNDWDVKRLTFTGSKIIAISAINNFRGIIISLTSSHSLVIGDYIGISNSQFRNLNGVYRVQLTPTNKSIVIAFDQANTITRNGIGVDGSTQDSYGNLYNFVSVRLSSMDNVNDAISYKGYRERNNDVPGDKVFADNVGNKWKIYEKVDPYVTVSLPAPDTPNNQEFGYRIVSRNDGKFLIVSAPGMEQGTIHFFRRSTNSAGITYDIVASVSMTDNDDYTSRLGESLSISTDENIVVAGAPYNNTIVPGSDSSRHQNAGLIKTYIWNNFSKNYDSLNTLVPPSDSSTVLDNLNFGWSTAVAEPTVSSMRSTLPKYLFVGAPGYSNENGIVYVYTWGLANDSTYSQWTQTSSIQSSEPGTGKRFGHRIAVNDNGDILAISSVSPGNSGKVEIFTSNHQYNDGSTTLIFTHRQTLVGVSADGSSNELNFGDSIAMSKDGTTLIVSASGVDSNSQDDAGAVYCYKWNADASTNTYTLQQTIPAPETKTNMRFGSSLSINHAANRLVIGAENFSNERVMKFDNGSTTFDLQDTRIVDLNIGSGGAFTATKYNNKFVIDQKLITDRVSTNDDFGKGVCVTDTAVYVGAPGDSLLQNDGSTLGTNNGSVAVYDLKTPGQYAWQSQVTEEELVDSSKIESAFIFDTAKNEIIDYLDYYDPIKGRILGLADREINYKTEWDPAIYTVGTVGKTVSTNTAWGEEHVGEVWWDLSQARWVWYEQAGQEHKTKNWGNLFPGSNINIYEWVESTLLPSEWASRADTTEGLSRRISGTPLHADNTVLTVKQKYDANSDSFLNYYYFWVKNSVFLPAKNVSVTERKNTTAYIANIIINPLGSGVKYFTISDRNSIITFNVRDSLVNRNTVLNINYRANDNESDVHTVWKIFKEGDKDDRPNENVEKKWWDSLIGEDDIGSEVPDLTLPLNQRYGNSIRPRQSWYKDRFAALKHIINYSNTVLRKYQLAYSVNFINLNSADPEPLQTSGEWDILVDTYADLIFINTNDISGSVNALVRADEQNSKGYWAIYNWNGTEWNRFKVQTYKTNNYYSFVDWYDTGIDSDVIIDRQLSFQYQLDTLRDLDAGKYVKVLNSDTGGWKIFLKTADGFKNCATQNGTIQLSNALYNYDINNVGFEDGDPFDNNFFDQQPTLETKKILTALRDDIFVGDLKVEYNNLFFIGLRRVLEEQLYVDWLFKTSFINVTNSVRPLDQRKTYKIGTDDYVESYINEVKPFHTKIREYKLGYTGTETQDGIYTDFDLPAFYDGERIRNINTITDTTTLSKYPYRFWRDNHKKYVHTITVTNGGSGYDTAPTVRLVGGTTTSVGPFALLGTSVSGDTSGEYGYFYPLYTSQSDAESADNLAGGSGASQIFTFAEHVGTEFHMPLLDQNISIADRPLGYVLYSEAGNTQATAIADIRNGSVSRITVLTPGSNYTATPTVVLIGGGADGTTPADTAKAYANLQNDLVRDVSTIIKFDRVKSTATILEWTESTAYAYNDLLRRGNNFYKVITGFTSTADFNDGLDNLLKLRGDEPYITAAERTLGLYSPATGMPGNELSQLMTGVDYGGVMVTGLAFSSSQGWDRSLWYEAPWDNYGLSRVQTFYGDGSSTAFTFSSAPLVTDVYTVYVNGVRQTSLVFRGDGSTKTFTVIPDDSSVVGNGDKIEFIPFDDDGVLTPTDDRTLDTLISGGLFGSAVGIAPSDVILEGDGFITPDTSYAPEENVPGSMFDTVDIKVYTAPESGVPFIINKNYTGDGTTKVFDIGQTPGTQASVIVTLDGLTLESEDAGDSTATTHVVDITNQTVTFTAAPVSGQKISIKSFAISGKNYMVLDTFTGDGSTVSFTTSARESFQLDSAMSQLYVTVDGVPTNNYTYAVADKLVTITFHTGDGSTANPPASGKSIQIAAFNQPAGSGRAHAEIRSEQFTYDGSTNRITLTYPPGAIGPFSGLTMLQLGGKILRGPDNTYYAGDGSTTTYGLGTDPANTVTDASQIEVYVNGTKNDLFTDYTVNIGSQQVIFVSAPGSLDVIAVSVLLNNHYYNTGDDIILKPSQLAADGIALTAGTAFFATTFNNAVGMNQRREIFQGNGSGEFTLQETPLNSNYVFVWLNGAALTHGYNFLTGANYFSNPRTLKISGVTLTSSDRIDVMYFAVEGAGNAIGFRIFKDMLNRNFFKRISAQGTTELAEAVTLTSASITLADASRVASPPGGSVPGVIFIGEERIEYFIKAGNTLSQLRRATLGTALQNHASGAQVVDASASQTVPYAETIYAKTTTTDGSTSTFPTSLAPATPYELDVFVGGRRLPYVGDDGSSLNFTIDYSTANITLAQIPVAEIEVKVVQKRGRVWYTAGTSTAANGKGLQKSTTNQALFLSGEPTNAPE